MTDFRTLLADLKRPRLLLRAARLGLMDYCRERDLKRLLKSDPPAGPEKTLRRLMQEEEQLEATRRKGDASYSISRHVDILIALLAELHLLPRPQQRA
ncbi:DUF6477 family protein [Gemmobacter denitrificans]|uniref:DUF6477 family protein n=1 Tax=Gemmobacter denitrificans TaxID=3123040 RepID=A0ABU8BRR8_9RHOB